MSKKYQRTISIINSAQEGASLITKQGAAKNSLVRYLIPLKLGQLETLFGDGLIHFLISSLQKHQD